MLWHDPAIFHLLLPTSSHSQKSAATSHLHQTFGKIPEPCSPLASTVASSVFLVSFSWEQSSWGFWTEYVSSASWGSGYLMLLLQSRADLAVPHQHYCSSLHRSKFTGWAMGCRLLFILQWGSRAAVFPSHCLLTAEGFASASQLQKATNLHFFCWSLSEKNTYKPLKLLPRIAIAKKYRDDSSRHFVYRLIWVNANFCYIQCVELTFTVSFSWMRFQRF